MKILLSALFLLCPAAAVMAGPMMIEDYSKNPITEVPMMNQATCPCFDGKLEFGIYASAIFPQGGSSGHDYDWYGGSDDSFDDAAGAGISVAYYFNRNLGVDLGAVWFDTDSQVHNYTLDLVYRFPLGDGCIAPYVFVGGGVHTNGETAGLYRAGAGIDIRFERWNCIGLFADGIYTWTAGNIQDYAEGRVGMRVPF